MLPPPEIGVEVLDGVGTTTGATEDGATTVARVVGLTATASGVEITTGATDEDGTSAAANTAAEIGSGEGVGVGLGVGVGSGVDVGLTAAATIGAPELEGIGVLSDEGVPMIVVVETAYGRPVLKEPSGNWKT